MTRDKRIAATHRALGRFIEEAREEITARENHYYIGWRAIKTGAKGHGTHAFTRPDAERIIEALNTENKGWTEHFLVPIPS